MKLVMKMEGVLQLVYYPFFSSVTICPWLWEVYTTRGFVNLKNYFQNYMEVSLKPKKQKEIWNPKFISKSTTKSRFQNCTEGSVKPNQKTIATQSSSQNQQLHTLHAE
jgi:hypothetical protein